MWTCLNEKPGRKSPGPAARGDSARTTAMPYPARVLHPPNDDSRRRGSSLQVRGIKSKEGRRRRDAGSSKRHGLDTHFREVAIARRSKHSSSGSAVTTEPRRSIMRRRAASMASRAASRVLSRWRPLDAIDAASPPGGRRANVPPAPWHAWTGAAAASRAARDRAPFTPSTRHVTNSGSSPSSAEPRRVPQAPRDRFASACASSSLGPWSDDPSASVGGRDRTISAARIRSGSTTGSCTRAFPLFANRSAI